MSQSKVWFITGASRGFGRIWAEAALKRGDRVAATARDLKSQGRPRMCLLGRLTPLPTDKTPQIRFTSMASPYARGSPDNAR